jgi:hypothetical protein
MSTIASGPPPIVTDALPENYTGEPISAPEPIVTPEPVVETPVVDVDKIKADAIAEYQRQQELERIQSVQSQPAQVDPDDEMVDLLYNNPKEYTRRVKEQARNEVMAQVAPHLAPVQASRVLEIVEAETGALEPETRAYMKDFASQVDPVGLSKNPAAKEMLRLMAVGKNAEVQQRKASDGARVRPEPVGSEAMVNISAAVVKDVNDDRKSR